MTFTVAATTTGFYPPNYQWKRGGNNIAGADQCEQRTFPLGTDRELFYFVVIVGQRNLAALAFWGIHAFAGRDEIL